MDPLQPCSKCRRHLRADSQSCPFCGARSMLSLALPLVAVLGLTACPSGAQSIYAGPPPPDQPVVEEGVGPDEAPDLVDDEAPKQGDEAEAPHVERDADADSEAREPARPIYAAPPPREE